MPYFTATDDRQLHHLEAGSGSPVIVLPGSTASSAIHQNDIERLKGRYRAVSLDFRGTGKSGLKGVWPDDWWRQAARDISALIARLGYERAALIGTSGGAIVALWCAILPGHIMVQETRLMISGITFASLLIGNGERLHMSKIN